MICLCEIELLLLVHDTWKKPKLVGEITTIGNKVLE